MKTLADLSHFLRISWEIGWKLVVSLDLDLDLFVVLRRVQQPGSYCDG